MLLGKIIKKLLKIERCQIFYFLKTSQHLAVIKKTSILFIPALTERLHAELLKLAHVILYIYMYDMYIYV